MCGTSRVGKGRLRQIGEQIFMGTVNVASIVVRMKEVRAHQGVPNSDVLAEFFCEAREYS